MREAVGEGHERDRVHRGERGSSLLLALGAMLLFGVLATSLLTAAGTSERTSPQLQVLRTRRSSGDGAVAAAVNWLKVNPALGRDPAAFVGDRPCALTVVQSTGTVTATCTGDAGSGALPTGSFPNVVPLRPRSVTIVACTRGPGRAASVAACDAGAGDLLLVRARVRFDVTTDDSNVPASNVPSVLSWVHLT